jgi:hypothetical protein
MDVGMRPRTVRLIEVVEEKGIFGKCSCGGEVLFYSDSGVRCKRCGKLYGTWFKRKKVAIKHSQESLLKREVEESTENPVDAYVEKELQDLI